MDALRHAPSDATARQAVDPAEALRDRVAVVLVNYNSGPHLRRCLQSLRDQTVRPARVIVVDNASSDQSLAAAADALPTVEIVRQDRNLGFAAANNVGIARAADCRWIALLNVDACAEPRWLEHLLAETTRRPACAVFGGKLVSARDPALLDGTGDVYHASGRAWRRDWGQPAAGSRTERVPTLAPCAAAALYRRDALLAVGGFDEDYFCYFEDVDLGLRLRLAGYDYQYVPQAVVAHVGSAISGRHSDFYLYHGHRNLVWCYVKNMPWPLLWLYLPQHLLLNLATIGWFVLRGRGRVILRAKRDALAGLPRVWRQRRAAMRERKLSTREFRRLLARGWLRPYRPHG